MSKSNIFKFDDFDDVRGKIRIFKNIKNFQLKQLNYSESKKHVIRGMHYQKKNLINKIIYITHGKILDVLVNIKTKQISYYLLDNKNPMLFIPKDFAHGFQVLSDCCILNYCVTSQYYPACEITIDCYDDDLNIEWLDVGDALLSDKDRCGIGFSDYIKNYRSK